MSQDQIINILKSNRKKWFSAREIRDYVDSNPQSIGRSIRKIIKFSKSYKIRFKSGKNNKFFLKKI
jgi:hypothetical protein